MFFSNKILQCFAVFLIVGSLISNHQVDATPWIGDHKKDTTNIDTTEKIYHKSHKFGVNAEGIKTNGDVIIELPLRSEPQGDEKVYESTTRGKYIHIGKSFGINLEGQHINGDVEISWGNIHRSTAGESPENYP